MIIVPQRDDAFAFLSAAVAIRTSLFDGNSWSLAEEEEEKKR